ncbi:MAG: hypothetical protein ACE5GZ_12805, partial [Gammaproteobacteria bacterium]
NDGLLFIYQPTDSAEDPKVYCSEESFMLSIQCPLSSFRARQIKKPALCGLFNLLMVSDLIRSTGFDKSAGLPIWALPQATAGSRATGMLRVHPLGDAILKNRSNRTGFLICISHFILR